MCREYNPNQASSSTYASDSEGGSEIERSHQVEGGVDGERGIVDRPRCIWL